MLRHQFNLALAAADLSQSAWAKLHGVRQTTISNVMAGRLKSAPVERLMRAFIAEQLPKLAKELSEAA